MKAKAKKDPALQKYLKECEFAVAHFEKYVDANLDPLIDKDGNQVYEVEVLRKLSPKAQEVGRDMFSAVRRAAKQQLAITQRQK